jgi:nitroreductase
MNLNDFEQLAQTRRAVRHFLSDPIEEGLLERLLRVAHWAPSGYNLQPTHYVLVQDPAIRAQLLTACMGQKQIVDAPAAVVFTGDRRAAENNLERMLQMELAAGSMDSSYEQILRKYVTLGFSHEPLGLGWLWKSILIPILRFFTPIPTLPAVYKTRWLTKQVALNAMVFMLAAHSAGLATVPMEGFDESRVKKLLNIPSTHIAPLLIPVGYPADNNLTKTRLPLEGRLHHNGW